MTNPPLDLTEDRSMLRIRFGDQVNDHLGPWLIYLKHFEETTLIAKSWIPRKSGNVRNAGSMVNLTDEHLEALQDILPSIQRHTPDLVSVSRADLLLLRMML